MGGKSKKPRHVANRANASNSSQTVRNRNYKANLIKASSYDELESLESELSQERRELFRKKLSESDVKTHLKIEYNDALEFFRILSNDEDKVFHEVYDSCAKLWRFESKADPYDANGGIFLCGDWKKFSKANGLAVNDEVIFYENQGFWRIDIERSREKDDRQGDFTALGERKTMAQTGHKEMEGHLNMMTNTMVADNARSSSETLLNFSSDPNLLLSPSSHSFGPPYSQTEITDRSRMDKLGPIISSDDCARGNAYVAKEFPGTLVHESVPKSQEYRELFRKKLSKSDVEDHLKLEMNSMLNSFLHFTNENNVVSLELLLGNDNKEIPLELSLYDFVHNLWKFTGYLNSEDAGTLYLNNGWKDFVGARDVMENDIVVFYDFDSDQGEVKERCLMIDIEPHDAKAREDHFNMMPKSMVANIARKSSQTLLNILPPKAQEYRELFRKKLSKSDVEDHLKLEKNSILNNFLHFTNENNAVSLELRSGNDNKEIPLELSLYDFVHNRWKFTGYLNSEDAETLYFNNGWKDFVGARDVMENDTVVFYDFDSDQGEVKERCLMIDIEPHDAKAREDHFNMMPESMVANIVRKSSQTLLNILPDPSPQHALSSHSFKLPDSQAVMANGSCKHNLAARFYEVPGRSSSQGGEEFRELFWKKLAKTDVDNHLRLSNGSMLNSFLKFQNESNVISLGLPLRNDDKEIPLELEVYDDSEHVLWKFTGYQSSEEMQVLYFNNGWKDFVKTKGVKENDIIVFYNFVKGCGEHKKSCLMISIERNSDKVRELRCL